MYRKSCRKNKTWNGLYSLGRLCQSLGIDLDNRHRAGGDADATAILFTRLLAWDTTKEMDVMIKKTSQDQRLPLTCLETLNNCQKNRCLLFYNEFKSNLRW
jgi:DNA polymerase III epsilon subunit-like protein